MIFQEEKAFQTEEKAGIKAWGRRARQDGRRNWHVYRLNHMKFMVFDCV